MISVENDKILVEVGGTSIEVGTQLIEEVRKGDFVLVHSGFALQVISQADAEAQLEFIRAMKVQPEI